MYTIDELALMSGFTTRTLRNYIKADILHGDRESGIWQFSDENINEFFRHPFVQPGIQTKQNAIVYDYLAGQDNKEPEMCVLLSRRADDEEAGKISEFFCSAACKSAHIRFAFSYKAGKANIVLKGEEKEISEIMQSFYSLRFYIP